MTLSVTTTVPATTVTATDASKRKENTCLQKRSRNETKPSSAVKVMKCIDQTSPSYVLKELKLSPAEGVTLEEFTEDHHRQSSVADRSRILSPLTQRALNGDARTRNTEGSENTIRTTSESPLVLRICTKNLPMEDVVKELKLLPAEGATLEEFTEDHHRQNSAADRTHTLSPLTQRELDGDARTRNTEENENTIRTTSESPFVLRICIKDIPMEDGGIQSSLITAPRNSPGEIDEKKQPRQVKPLPSSLRKKKRATTTTDHGVDGVEIKASLVGDKVTFVTGTKDCPFADHSVLGEECAGEAITGITPKAINDRARQLFKAESVERPCVSSRLFACFTLYLEKTESLIQKVTPLKKRPTRSVSQQSTEKQIQPILELLRSLVNVEVVSLGEFDDRVVHGGSENSGSGSTVNNTNICSRKQVHFSGFDCSSTHPPMDRIHKSASQRHDNIQALVAAKEQVENIVGCSDVQNRGEETSNSTRIQSCLDAMQLFLGSTMRGREGRNLREACAKSMPIHQYHNKRIERAAANYEKEIDTLRTRLCNKGGAERRILFLEKRLAEFVGQAIRYHLRMFFDAAPPRLCADDTDYDSRSETYSQVPNLVEMTMQDDDSTSTVVEDGCISALISSALCYIYGLFGMNAFVQGEPTPAIPTQFCQSPASQEGISFSYSRAGAPPPPSRDKGDMEDIRWDIQEAGCFLATTRACQFLQDLFDSKGVQQEIAVQGGWGKIETLSTITYKYDLWKHCPNDAHLALLSNVKTFSEMIRSLLPEMKKQEESCEKSLDNMAKRFRIKTRSKNLLAKFPEIKTIACYIEEARECASTFPSVTISS